MTEKQNMLRKELVSHVARCRGRCVQVVSLGVKTVLMSCQYLLCWDLEAEPLWEKLLTEKEKMVISMYEG